MSGGRAARPLRVGRIDFANCTPIFRALEEGGLAGGVTFVRGIPTELNRKLRTGTVDVSPSSSVEYLENPGLYSYLPDLSISSIGPVGSVLLFSRRPLDELGGRLVAVSPASATSVLLLRILLERFRGLRPTYGAPGGGEEAVLWIGDHALQLAAQQRWPFVYDLGSLWFEETGTPFVFALWICRREAFQSDPAAVRDLYRGLLLARHRAYRSYTTYARESPEARWLGETALLAYWQTISYDLTEWHRVGLRRFCEEASAAGLLRGNPPLEPLPVEGDG